MAYSRCFFLFWTFLLRFLGKVIPFQFIRNRHQFETLRSPSWKSENLVADFAFEVSSEGELEMVLPLIEELLAASKKIELIYCSPSAKDKVLALEKIHSKLMRVAVLPVLGSPLEDWITAKKLFLCRYDFWPNLMAYGLLEDVEFGLFAASLQGRDYIHQKYSPKGIFFRYLFSLFDFIVTVNKNEKNTFLQWCRQVEVCDMRIVRVEKRLKAISLELQNWGQALPLGKKNRLVMGSFWPNESRLFDAETVERVKKGDLLLVIVPHKIDESFISDCQKSLETVFGEIAVELKTLTKVGLGRPVLLAVKGILCELYSFFNYAYVGGGFGEGVHSLLEPYIAKCQLGCGPQVEKSPEFSQIKNVTLLNNSLKELWSNNSLREESLWSRDHVQNFKVLTERICHDLK